MQQANREQLTICLKQLLERPELRAQMGAKGQQVVADNQGAVMRLTTLVSEQLKR